MLYNNIMEKVTKCKHMCGELNQMCHNTKNRVIEKMCECKKTDCKVLAKYLQLLMMTETLCNYICLCCCEDEKVTPSIKSELNQKCKSLVSTSDKLLESLSEEHCKYLRCQEIKMISQNCIDFDMKKKDKTKKKKK